MDDRFVMPRAAVASFPGGRTRVVGWAATPIIGARGLLRFLDALVSRRAPPTFAERGKNSPSAARAPVVPYLGARVFKARARPSDLGARAEGEPLRSAAAGRRAPRLPSTAPLSGSRRPRR